ncbi:MAG: dihydrolipoyl dehydrogenase [Nitrospinota bacterium]|nr:dihydrolipoyl dehydrogenase [Nitrospinota bacterium]
MDSFDLVVLGGGPGGYSAALRAAGAGLKVAVVEKDLVGGACLNRGCVPAKAWIAGAETVDHAAHINQVAESPFEFTPSFSKIAAREKKIVAQFRKALSSLLKKKDVEVIKGEGAFTAPDRITAAGREIAFKHALIATGTAPARLFGLSADQALDTNSIFDMDEPPASMIIIGAGVVGCEFACVFARLGVRVTMLEMMPSILPRMDGEVARLMERELKKLKVEVITGANIKGVEAKPTEATAVLENGAEVVAEKVFLSVGRSFPTGALGLEKAGVKTRENGSVETDPDYRTSSPNIFAVGDVAGRFLLAYTAYREGAFVADLIAGKSPDRNFGPVPMSIFTIPEIGAVGVTQEDAPPGAKVGSFMFRGLARAHATGEIAGFVKIIADGETDLVLGAHMIGPRSTDMIHIAAVAMKAGMTARQLGETLFAHPTLAEAVLEAAHDVHGQALHK